MWYDIVVVLILAICTIRGAAKGVIWQLAGIVGLVLCFTFAETISAAVGPHVDLPPPTNHWVVMFGAYLAFSLLSFSMARSIDKWIEKHEMKEYNQHLGAIFGFAKGVVICLVLTFFIVTLSSGARDALRHSQSGRMAAIIMDRLHPVMPENLHHALSKYIHQLDSDDLPLIHNHDSDPRTSDSDTELGDPQATPPLFSSHPTTNQPGGASGIPATSIPHGSSIPADSPAAGESNNLFETELRRLISRNLQSVPEPVRTQLSEQLIQVASRLSPADLLRLQQQLSQAGNDPQRIMNLIQSWAPAAPTQTSVPAGTGAGDRTQELLSEISGLYATRPESRRLIEADIQQSLAGIPDHVKLAVLEDWRADLFSVQPDPDPSTDLYTLLEERMYRQLQRNGIRLDQVSAEVQRRLRGVVER